MIDISKIFHFFIVLPAISIGACNESSKDNYPNPKYCDDRTEEINFYAIQPIDAQKTTEENKKLSKNIFSIWKNNFNKNSSNKTIKVNLHVVNKMNCKYIIPSGIGKSPSVIFYTIYYNTKFTDRSLVRSEENRILSANIMWLSDIDSSFCDKNKIINRSTLLKRPYGVRYGVEKEVDDSTSYDENYWKRFILENSYNASSAYGSFCKRSIFHERNPINVHPHFGDR